MSNEIKKPETKIIRNKEQFMRMQIEEHFQREKVKDIYKTEYLSQRLR